MRQAPTGKAGFAAWVATALLATGDARGQSNLAEDFERTAIVIEAGTAACYVFDVYLALTGQQQRRGLMHVRSLPKFSGMLFVYRGEEMRSMWMKNTYVPLDILFIRADGSVATIAAHTEPLSLRSISSGEPVAYVLELNAGVTEELGIDSTSRVQIPQPLATGAGRNPAGTRD